MGDIARQALDALPLPQPAAPSPELLAHVSTGQLKRWRSSIISGGPVVAAATISIVLSELLSREIAHPARQARDPSPTPHRGIVNGYNRFAADVSPPVA